MLLEFIINESRMDDMIKKYPKLEQPYKDGLLNNIKPQYIQWIVKQQEPVADVVGLINVFEKNIQRLKDKDINKYSSSELRRVLNDLGDSKTKEKAKTKDDATTLGTFGPWIVVMPHSRESSILWGKDTTWCTAATKTQNLFLTYVARKHSDIILYYIINQKENPRTNKEAKLSIGFINGQPVLNGDYGGVSVNSNNDGIDQESLKHILKDQYDPILMAMTNHAKTINNKHPAKKRIEDMIKDPKSLMTYLHSLTSEEIKQDAVDNILSYIDDNDLGTFGTAKDNFNTIYMLCSDIIAAKKILDTFYRFRFSNEQRDKIFENIFNLHNKDLGLMISLTHFESLPDIIYEKLARFKNEEIQSNISVSHTTPPSILHILAKSKFKDVRQNVARNRNTPQQDLYLLADDPQMLRHLSANIECPSQILFEIIHSKNMDSIENMLDTFINNRQSIERDISPFLTEIIDSSLNELPIYYVQSIFRLKQLPDSYVYKYINTSENINFGIALKDNTPGELQLSLLKNNLKNNKIIRALVDNHNFSPLLNPYFESDELSSWVENYILNDSTVPSEEFLMKIINLEKNRLHRRSIINYAQQKLDKISNNKQMRKILKLEFKKIKSLDFNLV